MQSQASPFMAAKRLSKELETYQEEGENEIFLYLRPVDEADLLLWEAVLKGPVGTPYEGGLWHLTIEVPPTYPNAPPTVQFTTKIVHPNIKFDTGKVCLSLLDDDWSPLGGLAAVVKAVQLLLTEPNPDSPMNVEISILLRDGDVAGYESVVRYLTEEQRWVEDLAVGR
ncbi:hypothetical protein DTO013E5_1983 [Penicillium roqueforti]|uniref:Ubiquitin-conjugating enzyme E2 16 n=1 Tax=Penicillium roqueforti (strain FM164) TaxID=1365484 RepID=W6Q553_PENRF|nr:uncharacterized protein LCP9604111_44 [Penicillium roqueforti]XP_057045253.1 uncharacterized protein N7518_002876 [Penicillium psychrosexuale]CDM31758.1 Ubiquitin-conjugating enzyme E2 16 [Penicillium roqueforti FM164]KAF9252518.1 hypothetical protein LCP9604111_44 [Penicillium roqueforti]KAI1835589.1 hypothetical protein CBS147337_3612 [Penicillium roqueforti]KAI2675559.1 hypothetical protein CBS147355_6553 [Penicillium roqueforti]KAI2687174.1 hypothetical protein LCP963914a_3775 [Penicil